MSPINMSNNFLNLLGAIDNLWFHQTILFPEPISLLGPQASTETPQDSITNSSFTYPTSSMVSLAVADDEISSNYSTQLDPDIVSTPDSPETSTPQDHEMKRSTRLDIVAHRLSLIRSQSSSPISNDRRSPRRRIPGLTRTRKLEKSMSMKSLGELELEEVQGLMDLGFTFDKENLNPRMMSLVPGLQRLGVVGAHNNSKKTQNCSDNDDKKVEAAVAKDDDVGGGSSEDEVGVARPYLSEAWLIKRPDSPLLNLRLPTRVSSAADMKNHLKYWARTVASEVQQES